MNQQQEFEAWWDADCDTRENPYSQHSMMYWAWEAWKAGRAAENEACAKVCENMCGPIEIYNPAYVHYVGCAEAIRARGQHD